jgi:hypothetical protein
MTLNRQGSICLIARSTILSGGAPSNSSVICVFNHSKVSGLNRTNNIIANGLLKFHQCNNQRWICSLRIVCEPTNVFGVQNLYQELDSYTQPDPTENYHCHRVRLLTRIHPGRERLQMYISVDFHGLIKKICSYPVNDKSNAGFN